MGEPIEQSAGRLFTFWVCVVLFPGEDSRSCCPMEKAAKNCCGYSLGHPVCPEHISHFKLPLKIIAASGGMLLRARVLF